MLGLPVSCVLSRWTVVLSMERGRVTHRSSLLTLLRACVCYCPAASAAGCILTPTHTHLLHTSNSSFKTPCRASPQPPLRHCWHATPAWASVPHTSCCAAVPLSTRGAPSPTCLPTCCWVLWRAWRRTAVRRSGSCHSSCSQGGFRGTHVSISCWEEVLLVLLEAGCCMHYRCVLSSALLLSV